MSQAPGSTLVGLRVRATAIAVVAGVALVAELSAMLPGLGFWDTVLALAILVPTVFALPALCRGRHAPR